MFEQTILNVIHQLIAELPPIPEWVNFGAKGLALAFGATLLGYFFANMRSLMGAIVMADAAFFWGYWMRAF